MATTCTCGGGHRTYGACLRAKNISIGYCGQGGGDASRQKQWDAELNLYNSALAQGVEPSSTRTAQIRRELDLSDKVGKPFNAHIPGGF